MPQAAVVGKREGGKETVPCLTSGSYYSLLAPQASKIPLSASRPRAQQVRTIFQLTTAWHFCILSGPSKSLILNFHIMMWVFYVLKLFYLALLDLWADEASKYELILPHWSEVCGVFFLLIFYKLLTVIFSLHLPLKQWFFQARSVAGRETFSR